MINSFQIRSSILGYWPSVSNTWQSYLSSFLVTAILNIFWSKLEAVNSAPKYFLNSILTVHIPSIGSRVFMFFEK